jgi:hypothetical protein
LALASEAGVNSVSTCAPPAKKKVKLVILQDELTESKEPVIGKLPRPICKTKECSRNGTA